MAGAKRPLLRTAQALLLLLIRKGPGTEPVPPLSPACGKSGNLALRRARTSKADRVTGVRE
ncbi:hypothetical protein P7K49_027551 [Saguinus oedipus]|uniref:Uncharacterized protein n=1 Tax=Saguinus oedipus TaxID=9490 RepID=A0ABQ9U9S1_SAGOE|nr:hypothetical protein P7K49_027551 [Saguinus oedipus]